jgi:recombination protein RecA
MSSASDILKQINKAHGPSIAKMGGTPYADTPRIPTGIFPFDLATGGGFPMGRVTIVWGAESSNKTNQVLCAIGQGQKMFPGKRAVFVDAEHAFDDAWARELGVNTEELILIHPEFAEQAVDFIDSFLYADDVFMVALDSIAALSTQNEIESSAEKASVGGAALVVGKMFKKATVSFNRMRNQGLLPPAFVCINQVRNKIGVMYGSPDTMPGGFAPKFAASMIIRVHGKNIIDKKIDPVMPVQKEVSVTVSKWKVPIVSTSATYTMNMRKSPGRVIGDCEDWNTVSSFLKELDYLSKAEKGSGWVMFGKFYNTLVECKADLYGNIEMLMEAKAQIIKEILLSKMDGGTAILSDDPVETVDPDTGEILVGGT